MSEKTIAINRSHGHADDCIFASENSGMCSCGRGFRGELEELRKFKREVEDAAVARMLGRPDPLKVIATAVIALLKATRSPGDCGTKIDSIERESCIEYLDEWVHRG